MSHEQAVTYALEGRTSTALRTHLALLTSFDEAGSVRFDSQARPESVEVVSQP